MIRLSTIFSVCLLSGLLLPITPLHAKEKAEEQARPLLQAAADRSLLHADGSSPFKLKFTFEIRGSISKPMKGSYLWMRNGTGSWRKEIEFSDFSEVEVGDASTVWSKRSLDFLPLQAIWLEGVFRSHQYLNNADDRIERYFTRSEHHAELRCVDLFQDRKLQTLCFDSQGNLVKADLEGLTYEYSDYHAVAQRFVAKHVVLKRNEAVILEGTLESLPLDAKIDAPLFEPPAGARKRNGCLNPTLPKIASKVSPEYPGAALNARQQGTVTIYVRIASDGSVHDARVIQTSGRQLDEASLSALSRLQYEPARCANIPVDCETAISIKYSIRP